MLNHGRLLAPILGAGAVLISVLGILGALAMAPWFSLLDHALSDLGRSGRVSAPVFNGALVASGLLGVGFLGALWRDFVSTIRRGGIALFAVAASFIVLIGAFPTPHPYHYVASAGFYLALTFALLVYGTGDVLAGKVWFGLAMILLGIVHTMGWIVWWALGGEQGIAGPEALGAIMFSVWVCGMVWRSYRLAVGRRLTAN